MVISSETFKALPATVGLCLGACATLGLAPGVALRPPLKKMKKKCQINIHVRSLSSPKLLGQSFVLLGCSVQDLYNVNIKIRLTRDHYVIPNY